MSAPWSCPYCNREQILTNNTTITHQRFFLNGEAPQFGTQTTVVQCAGADCRKITARVWIGPWNYVGQNDKPDHTEPPLFSRRVLPEGESRPVPDFVPKAIRDDYREACLIRDLSPKASATLSRRCLQGMIRDFAKINVKSKRLFDEIEALEKAVEAGSAPRGVSIDSIEAITALRKVGNIGAHMEADIDLIVDVDPGEAQTMIGLIESLIEDWYVESHKRAARFALPVAVAEAKEAQLQAAKAVKAADAAGALAISDDATSTEPADR